MAAMAMMRGLSEPCTDGPRDAAITGIPAVCTRPPQPSP